MLDWQVTNLFCDLVGLDVWFPDTDDKSGADESIDAAGESNEWDYGESDETYLPYACESNRKTGYEPAYEVQEIPYLQQKNTDQPDLNYAR